MQWQCILHWMENTSIDSSCHLSQAWPASRLRRVLVFFLVSWKMWVQAEFNQYLEFGGIEKTHERDEYCGISEWEHSVWHTMNTVEFRNENTLFDILWILWNFGMRTLCLTYYEYCGISEWEHSVWHTMNTVEFRNENTLFDIPWILWNFGMRTLCLTYYEYCGISEWEHSVWHTAGMYQNSINHYWPFKGQVSFRWSRHRLPQVFLHISSSYSSSCQ